MGDYVIEEWASKKYDSRKDIEIALYILYISSSFLDCIGGNKFQLVHYICLVMVLRALIEGDGCVEKMYSSYSGKGRATRLWLKCVKLVDENSRPPKRAKSERILVLRLNIQLGLGYPSHKRDF